MHAQNLLCFLLGTGWMPHPVGWAMGVALCHDDIWGHNMHAQHEGTESTTWEHNMHAQQAAHLPWDFHVFTYTQKRYHNLLEDFCKFGLVLREHGNRYRTPHNRMPFTDVQAVVQFLHATGRLPGYKNKTLLFAIRMTKRSVNRLHVKACTDDGKLRISWAKFHSLWLEASLWHQCN